jgi:hypothetical protein
MKRLALILSLLLVAQARADLPAASNRMANRVGFSAGLLEPFPAFLGGALSYNSFDFLRVSAGGGVVTNMDDVSGSSVSAGLRLLVPGASLSPFAGLNVGLASLSGHVSTYDRWYGFSDGTSAFVSGCAGLDWQSAAGFNMGVGIDFRTSAAVPSLYVGWYF